MIRKIIHKTHPFSLWCYRCGKPIQAVEATRCRIPMGVVFKTKIYGSALYGNTHKAMMWDSYDEGWLCPRCVV